jgi:hypothetical protein
MDRRKLLTAGGAAAALALLPSPARAAVRLPLFEWERPGGLVAPGVGVLTPPPLAVYDDRTAFADATAGLRLSADRVEALRELAIQVLRYRTPDNPAAAGRPVDLIRVRTEAGDYRAARLDDWPHGSFPPPLRELWDEVQRLRRRVLRGGERWRPPAVLLAAVRLDSIPERFRPWPPAVPVPALHDHYGELRRRGDDARTVRRGLPAADPGRRWPAYRTGGGSFVAATWRSLLPHE